MPDRQLPRMHTGPARERLAQVAAMRLLDNADPVPFPGKITAAQAAARLGVTVRTIQRYKRLLRQAGPR